MKTLSKLWKLRPGGWRNKPSFFEREAVFSRKMEAPLLKRLDHRLS